jgi:tetratricopeptide (TPR) repeat protein
MESSTFLLIMVAVIGAIIFDLLKRFFLYLKPSLRKIVTVILKEERMPPIFENDKKAYKEFIRELRRALTDRSTAMERIRKLDKLDPVIDRHNQSRIFDFSKVEDLKIIYDNLRTSQCLLLFEAIGDSFYAKLNYTKAAVFYVLQLANEMFCTKDIDSFRARMSKGLLKIGEIFYKKCCYDDAMKIYNVVEKYIKEGTSKDRARDLAEVHLEQGRVYFHQGRYTDAMSRFEEALKFPGDAECNAHCSIMKGRIHYRKRELEEADRLFNINYGGNNELTKGIIAFYKSKVAFQKGRDLLCSCKSSEDEKKAKDYIPEATRLLDASKKHLENAGRGLFRTRLVSAKYRILQCFATGLDVNHDEFKKVTQQSESEILDCLNEAQELQNEREIGFSKYEHGRLYLVLGRESEVRRERETNLHTALKEFEEALETFRSIRLKFGEAKVLKEMAKVNFLLFNYDTAFRDLEVCARLFKQQGLEERQKEAEALGEEFKRLNEAATELALDDLMKLIKRKMMASILSVTEVDNNKVVLKYDSACRSDRLKDVSLMRPESVTAFVMDYGWSIILATSEGRKGIKFVSHSRGRKTDYASDISLNGPLRDESGRIRGSINLVPQEEKYYSVWDRSWLRRIKPLLERRLYS